MYDDYSKCTKKEALEYVKKQGYLLRYLSLELKDDYDVVLTALKENSFAIEHASERLKNNKELALLAVKEYGYPLEHVSERLKNDKEVVLAAVKANGRALEYASNELKNDKDIIMTTINSGEYSFDDFSKKMKKDREVCLAAFTSKSYFSTPMYNLECKVDEEFLCDAMSINGMKLDKVGPMWKKNKNVVKAAVKQNPEALQYANKRLREDPEMINYAKNGEEENNVSINENIENKSLEDIINKLEAYFPEHKVFALDSIDSRLREKISKLYKNLGYESADDMLKSYGFEIIKGKAVKELRDHVTYTPGNEPDIIKSKIKSMLERLNEYYPNKIVARGIQNDHKKLSSSISGLYQWLGYSDIKTMLEAYGYTYQNDNVGGRPTSNNYDEIINSLIEKYKAKQKPKTLLDFYDDNQDIIKQLHTMNKDSKKIFNMTFKKYLESIGIIEIVKPIVKENPVSPKKEVNKDDTKSIDREIKDNSIEKTNIISKEKNTENIMEYEDVTDDERKEILDKLAKEYKYADLEDKYRNDKEIGLYAIKKNIDNIKYAGKNVRNDKDIALQLISSKEITKFKYLSDELKDNKEFVMRFLKMCLEDERTSYYGYQIYSELSKRLRDDKELLLLALRQGMTCISMASDRLKNDEEIAEIVAKDGYAFSHMSDNIKSNKKLILKIIEHEDDGYKVYGLFREVSKKFNDDEEVVLAAYKKSYELLRYASNRLKSDKNFIMKCVNNENFWRVFKYINDELKKDKDIYSVALKNCVYSYQYLPEEMKKDRNLVLSLVSEHGNVYEYLLDEFKNDKEITLLALQNSVLPLQLSNEMKHDKDILKEIIRKDGIESENIPKDILDIIYSNKEYVLEAIKLNYEIIYSLPAEFKDDKKFIKKIFLLDIIPEYRYSDIFEELSENVRNDKEIVEHCLNKESSCIYNLGDKLKNDKEFVLNLMTKLESTGEHLNYDYIFESLGKDLKDDEETVKFFIEKNKYCLKYASSRIKNIIKSEEENKNNEMINECMVSNDKEKLIEAVKNDVNNFAYINDDLKNNKQFVLDLIDKLTIDNKYNYKTIFKYDYETIFKNISEEMRNDPDVVLKYIFESVYCFKYAGNEIKNNKQFVLDLIDYINNSKEHSIFFYEYKVIFKNLGEKLRYDKDIAVLFISKDYECLKYTSEELKKDKNLLIPLIRNDFKYLKYASYEIKNDADLIFEVFNKNLKFNESYLSSEIYEIINLMPDKLLCDKEFIIRLMKQFNSNLGRWYSEILFDFILEDLQHDEEIRKLGERSI